MEKEMLNSLLGNRENKRNNKNFLNQIKTFQLLLQEII